MGKENRSSLHWVTPQVLTASGVLPDHRQEPPESPTWLAETLALGPPFFALPGLFSGSWLDGESKNQNPGMGWHSNPVHHKSHAAAAHLWIHNGISFFLPFFIPFFSPFFLVLLVFILKAERQTQNLPFTSFFPQIRTVRAGPSQSWKSFMSVAGTQVLEPLLFLPGVNRKLESSRTGVKQYLNHFARGPPHIYLE